MHDLLTALKTEREARNLRIMIFPYTQLEDEEFDHRRLTQEARVA